MWATPTVGGGGGVLVLADMTVGGGGWCRPNFRNVVDPSGTRDYFINFRG